MAILEDALEGGIIVTGLAIGIGAVIVAPLVIPVLRPAAKTALKAGLAAYDQGRVMLAELNEQVEDMMAEVRADMATQPQPAGNGSAARQSSTRHRAAKEAEKA
jgi:hypothetical protein